MSKFNLTNPFNLSVKRTSLEAVVLYLIWIFLAVIAYFVVITIILYFVAPHAATYEDGYNVGFPIGRKYGPLAHIITVIGMTLLTLRIYKKRKISITGTVIGLTALTFFLGLIGSFFLGLIIPAYLTTRKEER